MIQDTHINMPYQSWELRPLDVNKVLLTVITVFTEIQIQIKVNHCYNKSYPRGKLFDDCENLSKQSITGNLHTDLHIYKYI